MDGRAGPRKVFVLGLDGVPWELLLSLVRRGHLPRFAELLAAGTRAVLKSTLPPMTGPSWTSFATGVNPGRHGIFDNYHAEADFTVRPVDSRDIRVQTLPEILSGLGLQSVFINLPVSYPARPFNGVMVADLLSPQPYIQPPSMARYLDGYRIFFDTRLSGAARATDIIDVERRRLDLARRLVLEQSWDFFFLLVSGTDWMCHLCYRELLEDGPVGERALGLFDEVDAFLGWLSLNLPSDAVLLLLSDHGFHHCDRVVDINSWLQTHGYAESRRRFPPRMVEMVRKVPFLKRAFLAILSRAKGREVLLPSAYEVDIARSRAFSLFGVPGISINRNLVADDTEYQRLLGGIVAQLKELRDPFTGDPALEIILPRTEVYKGPFGVEAPDIVCIPKRGLLLEKHFLYPQGFAPADDNDHSLEGFLLLHGPGVPAGGNLGTVPMWDVTPTVLALLGTTAPGWMEGRVLSIVPAPETPRSPEHLPP